MTYLTPNRFDQLRRNKHLLFWCRFFTELNALQAIIQLFYLRRGLSIAEIFYLGIAWSLASIIFDIPTSIFADKYQRKTAITIGIFINVIACFSTYFCYGFIPFFINVFFTSVSFSFFSGIEDALLYDTLQEMKQSDVVLKTSGKYNIASKLSKMFTPLIGAIIANNLGSFQINILISINLISSVIALLISFFLVEPIRSSHQSQSRLALLKHSLFQIKSSPVLIKLIANKTLLFIASFIFFKYYQTPLVKLGANLFLLGFLYVIFNGLIILVYSKTEYIFRRFNHQLIFELPVWITIIGSIIFTYSTNPYLSYFVTIFLIITGVIRDPFFNQQVQWRISSDNRSIIPSILGLSKSLSDIPLLFLAGFLSQFNSLAVMSLPIALSLIILLFFRLTTADIISHQPSQQ